MCYKGSFDTVNNLKQNSKQCLLVLRMYFLWLNQYRGRAVPVLDYISPGALCLNLFSAENNKALVGCCSKTPFHLCNCRKKIQHYHWEIMQHRHKSDNCIELCRSKSCTPERFMDNICRTTDRSVRHVPHGNA